MKVAILAFGAALMLATQAGAAGWQYEAKRDKFTDDKTSYASASNGSGWLYVRCQAGRLEAYLVARTYLNNEGADVRWRVDRGVVEDEGWSSSNQGDGVFSPYPSILARQLMGGSQVVLEVTDFRDVPHELAFSLAGSSAAIGRVMGDCGIVPGAYQLDDTKVWERVVADLDKLDLSTFQTLQSAMHVLFPDEVKVTSGRRDLATYRAATLYYAGYWALCDKGEGKGALCDKYRAARERDSSAGYPGEFTDLMLEWMERVKAETEAEPAT